MGVYLVRRKGWRYDFTLKKQRYSDQWFETKREAIQAEAKKREELNNPKPVQAKIPIDMDFLTLVNKRLDKVKHYDSSNHFMDTLYHSRRWVKEWNGLNCNQITPDIIEKYVLKRAKVSHFVANKEIQYLRALFNYGIKKKLITENPATELEYFPVEKSRKYLPPKEDVLKVISVADPDTQDYLWTILLTAGRVSEINELTWNDVNFDQKFITLWTRKRKGGNREPRDVPMIKKLYGILKHRHEIRDPDKPWVFWHSYWSRKQGVRVEGPYIDRKKIMSTLCDKADVKYFRYHALRHLTASVLDDLGTPIGAIQRILGHQNRKTTEIYLHSVGESERRAMEMLDEIDIFSDNQPVDRKSPRNVHQEYWQRKVERPDYETLKEDIENLGYVRTGKKYGVSNNAVKKWLKFYQKQFETV